MTPQERQLIDDLFDRLARLESAPRDSEAVAAISDGLRRAPNALYPLVQTVLLQDEALKRANGRIQELEAAHAPAQAPSGGFLDSMRDTLFGQAQPRGSVPPVRPPETSRPVWNTGQAAQQAGFGAPPPVPQAAGGSMFGGGGGGSFLGTAAAAAAGVVGGSLLLGSIRNMMGGSHHGFGDSAAMGGGDRSFSPWSSDPSGGSLARDAGIDNIGGGGGRSAGSGQGLFDQASYEDDDGDADDMDMDADDFGGGDTDVA